MTISAATKCAVVGQLGVLLLVLGGVLGWVLFPALVKDKITENLVLKPGTTAWDNWLTSAVPVYMKFWLFNLTNAEYFFKFGEKPVVEEVGPYVYQEIKEKWDIDLSQYKDTVKFLQNTTYVFRDDMSSGSENDSISTLNTLLVAVAATVSAGGDLPAIPFMDLIKLKKVIESEPASVTHGIREILFDGFHSDLAEALQELRDKMDVPDNVKDGTFAYFNGKNRTDNGQFEVYTGDGDISKFSLIRSWRGQPTVDFWSGEDCNMINGTDGMQFPPFVTKDRPLRIFNTDLCRSLYATYEKEVEFRGIPAYRFIPPDEMMQDPADNPDNACFCVPIGHCHKAGVMNVKNCYAGAPLMMSAPHFYQGAREYRTAVTGISPVKEKHQTLIDVNPDTGIAIRAAKRLQINVELFRSGARDVPGTAAQPSPRLPITFQQLSKIPHTILPIMWMEESGEIDEASARTFISMVLEPQTILGAVKWVLLAAGMLLLLLCWLPLYMTHQRHQQEHFPEDVDSSL